MVTKAQDVQAIRAHGSGPARAARAGRLDLAQWLKDKTAKRALFALGDTVALVLSHIAAAAAMQHWLRVPRVFLTPPDYWLFYLPFVLAVLYLLDRNHSPDVRRPEKELELAVKGVSFAFLLLVCANFVVFKDAVFSRYLMVGWYVVALPLVLVSRFSLRHLYGALWRRGLARRRTLLLGSTDRLSEFHSLLAIQRYQAYDIVGVLPAEEPWRTESSERVIPVLGPLSQWREAARTNDVEQIVVCLPHTSEESHRMVSEILHTCLPSGIDVQVYSDVFASRQFNYELDEFSGFFRFFSAASWSRRLQFAAKKGLDLAAGVVGSAITLVALPVVAALIKLEDRGPIYYHSEFLDGAGNVRYYRKFRSMYTNAREILERDPALKAKFAEKQKLVDDPRVTRVGRVLRRYSIDELPEFFSVLRGDLSLVGPRTICRREAARYGEHLPKLLSAKAGLTGFWQVMGRQLTTYEERIQMDMFYIDHWSIWLDLWIVVKTFWKVLRAEGAY
ncbi:MAG TPA: sugar transferase [Candidatus Acidoferrales bacterium]|nr:sugar transferase [Candidatus Acidoferrales bacterium]